HLVAEVYRAIAPALPRGYYADLATRAYVVLIETEGKEQHLAKPDLTVLTEPPAKKRKKGGVALAEAGAAEAVSMRAFIAEKFEETFVEIYAEREERVLVTCIEVLSPSNKRSGTEGWKEYQRKRQVMLLGRANFIEIDLLRDGHKMPMLDPWPDSP